MPTTLANLVNPQVMADLVDVKLVDAMKFAPLADIDTTLQGVPGSVVYMPAYSYIGDASTLAEGSTLSVATLSASTVSATIHKIAQGVTLTDEAVLSAFGDPMNEAASQVALAIASALDNEVIGVLSAISGTMLYSTTASAFVPTDINNALEKFGEDVDAGTNVVIVEPSLYTALRNTTTWVPASEIAADRIVRGAVGEAYGCQVLVSNKMRTPGTAYIVKPGAVKIFLKRDTMVETDRDILAFSTTITASKHEVCYLYNASKAVKMLHA